MGECGVPGSRTPRCLRIRHEKTCYHLTSHLINVTYRMNHFVRYSTIPYILHYYVIEIKYVIYRHLCNKIAVFITLPFLPGTQIAIGVDRNGYFIVESKEAVSGAAAPTHLCQLLIVSARFQRDPNREGRIPQPRNKAFKV